MILYVMASAPKIDSFKSIDSVVGVTYGQWTVRWWQWALSIPSDRNPVVDATGLAAAQDQPKDVWFLAGIFGDGNRNRKYPLRKCKVPSGMPILIPVLNCEADSIEYPHLKTDQDIVDHVLKQVNSIEKKDCFVNGEPVSPERVPSDPRIFDVKVHPDFDRFHTGGGSSRASADGYWVFLKDLPIGEHTIRFEGSCENGSINSGAAYSLTVF
jgi:hypothetical protein